MKRKSIYFIVAISFFLCCLGCSNLFSPQSVAEAKTVFSSNKSIEKQVNKPAKQENDDAWNAYRSILLGDFSLIQDKDDKSEMEFLYKADTENGKCGWKYILMDFNKDGVDDLFIQLDSDLDSALLSYVDGKVKCIIIDAVEATCYLQPLKGGKLLETYDYWIAPTKTVYEFNAKFKRVKSIQYISMTVKDYKYFKESYSEIMDQFPTIKKEGVYYFKEVDGKKTSLSAGKWKKIQKSLKKQLIPEKEWNYCADLKAN